MAAGDELSLVVVGHVDHGKSTIVGRLMAESGALPEGKLEAIQELCRRTSRPFEYAFLLDALKEERAQGITIDVARCFFKTAKRNYTLVDAPGHIEFLKNMVTGAASAEAALLVIDAAEGIMENSRRHGYLLSMLGVRQLAVIVNKMDLVNYSQAEFSKIQQEYTEFLLQIGLGNKNGGISTRTNSLIPFIPVSGLCGDNITSRSANMGWYIGPTIIEQMDLFECEPDVEDMPLRLPVQDVYKFTKNGDNRRIVAGKVETGKIVPGDQIVFYPSQKRATVRSLEIFNGPESVQSRSAGWSTGFTMEEQIYVRRGEIATHASLQPFSATGVSNTPITARQFQANIFWLGKQPLETGKKYLLKIHTARVEMEIIQIHRVLDAAQLVYKFADRVNRNEVAECVLRLDQEIAFDLAVSLPQTGRFVIIDQYEISGGGIITAQVEDSRTRLTGMVERRNSHWEAPSISWEKRAERYNQLPCLILISGAESDILRKDLAKKLETRLFTDGKIVYFIGMANLIYGIDADLTQNVHSEEGANPDPFDVSVEYFRRLAEITHLMLDAGLILIISARSVSNKDFEILKTVCTEHTAHIISVWAGDEITTDIQPDIHLNATECPTGDETIKQFLQKSGIIFRI